MKLLYAAAKGMTAAKGGHLFAHTNHNLHVVEFFTLSVAFGAAVGLLLAWITVRRLRAGFEWALLSTVPLCLALLLVRTGMLSGYLGLGTLTVLNGLLIGHLVLGLFLQLQDRRAGDDRGHEARQRIGPQHLILRARATRKIANGGGGEMPIGVTRKGQLATIPAGGESGSHSLIVGATGAGKSTLLGVLAHEHAKRGSGVVVVEAKNDPGLEAQVRRSADLVGAPFVLVSPDGPTVWDLFANGGVDETVAKLLSCEEWSEPFYEAEATRFLRWVVRGMEGSGSRLTLPAILEHCEPDRLAAHVAKRGDADLAGEVDRFVDRLTAKERSDVAGLRSRLAVLAEAEFGRRWLDPDAGAEPVLDLGEAIRDRAIVYFRLDSERLGIVAEKVGAAIAIEIGAIASGLQGNPVPTLVAIDEFGAIEAEQIERLFTRGRAAGISAVIATQSMSDIEVAGNGLAGRVVGNLSSAFGMQMGPDDADSIARMAGQVGEWKNTIKTNGLLGMPAAQGTRTRGYRMRIHPSVLQHLGWGECAVIRMDGRGDDRVRIVKMIPSWERDNGSNGAGR
jgi:energy-coupling factor transporter ATP-binding protein EcfA2